MTPMSVKSGKNIGILWMKRKDDLSLSQQSLDLGKKEEQIETIGLPASSEQGRVCYYTFYFLLKAYLKFKLKSLIFFRTNVCHYCGGMAVIRTIGAIGFPWPFCFRENSLHIYWWSKSNCSLQVYVNDCVFLKSVEAFLNKFLGWIGFFSGTQEFCCRQDLI